MLFQNIKVKEPSKMICLRDVGIHKDRQANKDLAQHVQPGDQTVMVVFLFLTSGQRVSCQT